MSSNELEASLRLDGELDARFLMLCTPQLEQAHRALQARSHHFCVFHVPAFMCL